MSLKRITIKHFETQSGYTYKHLVLSYQVFGDQKNLTNNAVLVCHALTGNSHVAGENGWWNTLIGAHKTIDTTSYPVIAFNIPGNGFSGNDGIIEDYKHLTTYDIAKLFTYGLETLGVQKLHSVIGGSLGGMIVWEFAAHFSSWAEHFLPIATDYKSSNWVIGQNKVQEHIIENCEHGIAIARELAMLFYRTPQDFKRKFFRSWNEEKKCSNVESYLKYQGEKLEKRMHPTAYKTMTHLLSACSVAETKGAFVSLFQRFTGHIHIVGISSDILFPAYECREAFEALDFAGVSCSYNEIESDYGHDAFLIEFEQLHEIIKNIYKR